jgi:aromatic-L-amino-acid decarboxylase
MRKRMESREFRELGHRLVDRLAEYLDGIEDRPLFPDVTPAALDRLFDEPLPEEPASAAEVLRLLEEKLFPYCSHVNHPGYMGLITPTPTPVGILGDLVASALNQNIGAWTIGPSGVAMERRTVRWLTDLAGYDGKAGGNLTSGGTMANFLGLKLARDHASGDRAQHEGIRDRWAAYVSEERHVSVDKAADAVGIGRDGLRVLPTDRDFRVRLDALEEALAEDRARGIRPMCVIGLAGTTNTGSVDDLRALRRIADRERAWFHVDAAYGGGMLLSTKRPGILEGLALADSITMDPHKWFYAPLDAGAILVRDDARLTRSFGLQPAYLTDRMDAEGERYLYYVHGFEQSRRFRGLKVWMSFKRYGAAQIGRWIDGNIEQAERLYDLAAAHPDFEPATRPLMSAVCLRYAPAGTGEERAGAKQAGEDRTGQGRVGEDRVLEDRVREDPLAPLHAEVVRRIERGGRFWISTTVLKGKTWFRVNPVNFRTRREHMDALFDTLVSECGAVRGA